MKQIIEYVWNKPKYSTVKHKDGSETQVSNDQRERVGVMIGFVLPGTEKVAIGMSRCCSIDEFDCINGKKVPGFGLSLAEKRAIKHADTEWIKVHGVTTIPQELRDKGDEEGVWIKEVKVPASMVDNVNGFIGRCKRYFKDKSLPKWTKAISDENVMEVVSSMIRTKNMLSQTEKLWGEWDEFMDFDPCCADQEE